MNADRALFEKLGFELFQTEESAVEHCAREAARLMGTPLASPLLQVAGHAKASLSSLPSSVRARPRMKLGRALGGVMSVVRNAFVDRMIDRERSFRGTLLGMRHGIDLVRTLGPVGKRAGDAELVHWCDRWLMARVPLVEDCAAQLSWFSAHAEFACERGTATVGGQPLASL